MDPLPIIVALHIREEVASCLVPGGPTPLVDVPLSAVRGLGRASPAAACLQTHVAHEPLDPATGVPVALSAQFSVDPRRAVDAPLGGKDPADVPAQVSVRFGTSLLGRDRAQPSVKAGHARADHPAQRGDGMVRPLG